MKKAPALNYFPAKSNNPFKISKEVYYDSIDEYKHRNQTIVRSLKIVFVI